MKAKTYMKIFIIIFCAALLFSCAAAIVLDPFFQYHLPLFGLQPMLYDEIYQNAGVAKSFEYDSIIIGSSLSENFDAQWFNEAFNTNAIKLTNSGASVENLKINIVNAENAKNQKLEYVFCNMENNMLNHTYNEPRSALPEYLYDDNIINDISYLLNKDTLVTCGKMLLLNMRHRTEPITRAYQWYRTSSFSKEIALKRVKLPEVFAPVEQKEADISDNSLNGINVLTGLVEEYPNTQFYFFYSPVSIIYWYSRYEEGNVLSETETLKYSMEQLLQYDNVHLFFPSTYEMITDLNNYKDEIHYSMDIQRLIFEQMRDGENELTKENYEKYIDDYRDMILNCDFEKIFR